MYKKSIQIIFYFIFAIIFLLIAINLTKWLYSPVKFNIFKYIIRSFFLITSLACFWKTLLIIVQILKIDFLKNVIASLGSFLSIIIILEIILSFIPFSSGGESNLFSKNWFNYYWEENELGFRDKSPINIDNKDKKNIFFIGDSFIAGHGIKNKNERMTNVLKDKFKDCFDIFNISVCGSDTKDQLKFIESYPIKPDLIILSHHRNDIERVLSKRELSDILNFRTKGDFKRFQYSNNYFFKNSFLLNFIDSLVKENKKIKYSKSLQTKSLNIETFMTSGEIGNALKLSYYNNDILLDLHLKDLKNIVNYSIEVDAPIIILLFTDLRDLGINITNKIVNEPITQYLEPLGVHVINTTEIIQSINEKERIVNKFNSHPSVLLNKKIANFIETELVSSGVSNKLCE